MVVQTDDAKLRRWCVATSSRLQQRMMMRAVHTSCAQQSCGVTQHNTRPRSETPLHFSGSQLTPHSSASMHHQRLFSCSASLAANPGISHDPNTRCASSAEAEKHKESDARELHAVNIGVCSPSECWLYKHITHIECFCDTVYLWRLCWILSTNTLQVD